MKSSILLLLILLCSSELFAQWSQTNGIYTGYIGYIVSKDANTLYGITENGLIKSTDNGLSWIRKPELEVPQTIYSLAVKGSYIYAGSFNKIYISSNDGNTWIENTAYIGSVRSFAIIDDKIFAAGNYVYVSTNNGSNWSLALNISAIQVLYANGQTIFASDYSSIYYSTNSGTNWFTANFKDQAYAFAKKGSNFYAGTPIGFYVSTNNGLNWNLRAFSGIDILNVAVSGNDLLVIKSLPEIALLRSTNDGLTWTQTLNYTGPPHFSGLISNNMNVIAPSSAGVFISTNSGINWFLTGYDHASIFGLGKNANALFASKYNQYDNSYGVYRSFNMGSNWTYCGLDHAIVKCFAGNGNIILAGTDHWGIYRSTNNGTNWLEPPGLKSQDVRVLFKNGSRIFAGVFYNITQGVFFSDDDGTSWSLSSLDYEQVYSITANENYIFAGTYLHGIYSSIDGGENWTQTSLNNQSVISMASLGNRIFAGVNNSGVYTSTNNGITWIQTSLNDKRALSLTTFEGYIVAGTNGYGVYISSDNGASWFQKNQGMLNTGLIVPSLLVADNNLVAGTGQSSVLRRSLSEIVGINSISNVTPSGYSLKQNYPNPFNPSTNIKYELPISNFVTLKIYDVLGNEVKTLVSEKQNAGSYSVTFDAASKPSGIYFYKLVTDGFTETKKLVLIK